MIELDEAIRARIEAVMEDGREHFHNFDLETRSRQFHPFVPANYNKVLEEIRAVFQPGLRFLEWGSGTGVITIMADMLGYEAYGIELDAQLVDVARGLAARHHSNARFAAGSFLPMGYVYRDSTGDERTGTIGQGRSGYIELQHPLDDFDVVFGYPWPGEADLMQDLMKKYGRADATFLLHKG